MYGGTLIAGKPRTSHDMVISASIIIFFSAIIDATRFGLDRRYVSATVVRRFAEFRLLPSVSLPLALPRDSRFFDKIVYSPFYF